MNVGDYVRIKTLSGQGKIAKLEKIDDICITDNGAVDKNNIIKSSPNIIDLIEVEDYVNGYKITMIENEYYDFATDSVKKMQNKEKIKIILGNEEQFYGVYAKDIKSIVTKEQFESMEYKIGE